MSRRSSRRDFLKQTSIAGLGFWAAGGLALADSTSPNEKINIACIGVGGKGDSDTSNAADVGNVVALCDIDDNTLNRKANQLQQRGKEIKKYHDFRKMLDEMGKQIDAVTVSTPDHTHAQAAIRAMRMGKHVYCQKPLTHTVWEARLMRQTAREHKVCTQMGNQGTASNGLRQAVEVIRSGALGPVREVHVWTNRPIWPQAPAVTSRPPSAEPPRHVHWDLWLTGAPYRPYADHYENPKLHGHPYHDFNWRGWWDFGTGALGDMACHTANMAYMGCKLDLPTSIEAQTGPINPETYMAWAKIKYDYPAHDGLPPVTLYWYEGHRDGKKLLPPKELAHGKKFSGSGSLVVGDKGVLFSPNDYGGDYVLLPEKDFEGYKPPAPTLPRNGRDDLGMKQEWVKAIKANKPHIALSNFDYSSKLTEAMILGNVAARAGHRIEYDPESGKVTNDPEANHYIRLEYRKGWDL